MRESIDGASFAQAMIHAAASLNLQKQQINELNVFPVPDGDTGTNMSLTLGTAAAELRKKQPHTVGEAAATNASALLRGARGNSGVILSLLFRGFAKAVKDKDSIDGRDLAIALDFGVAAAYKAVMKPAEGTILTVSRLAAARAAGAAREDNCFEAVLEAAIQEGQLALADTVNQNPVLKKAGVVDAGGAGELGDAADGELDLLAHVHHEVGQLGNAGGDLRDGDHHERHQQACRDAQQRRIGGHPGEQLVETQAGQHLYFPVCEIAARRRFVIASCDALYCDLFHNGLKKKIPLNRAGFSCHINLYYLYTVNCMRSRFFPCYKRKSNKNSMQNRMLSSFDGFYRWQM